MTPAVVDRAVTAWRTPLLYMGTRDTSSLHERISMLLSSLAPTRELDRRCHTMNVNTAQGLLLNPHLTGRHLHEISRIDCPRLKVMVTEHEQCRRKTLRRLAKDPSPMVRCSVAAHPRLPRKVQKRLAVDRDLDVRIALAGNPATDDAWRALAGLSL